MEDKTTDMLLDEAIRKALEECMQYSAGSDEAEKASRIAERLYEAQTGKFRAEADWAASENKREFEERIHEEELAQRAKEESEKAKLFNRIDPNVVIKCGAGIGTVVLAIFHDLAGHTLDGGILKMWKHI